MKFIAKGPEPELLLAFKRGESSNWVPSFAALSDQTETKRELKEALLSEQGFLCCYCCGVIDAATSHFEHFWCQVDFPEMDLDYPNLLASCTVEGKDRHCGAKKANAMLEVSPIEFGCEERFVFDLQGGISATSEDSGAEGAIRILGLGNRLLRESRRQAISAFTEGIDELSQEDLERLVEGLCERDSQGRYTAYQPSVVQVLVREFLRSPRKPIHSMST